jgi:protein-tyrosine-phosphatase
MAEVLFEAMVEERDEREEWRVESAGVWAYGGAPATGHAQTVVAERGLDLSEHRSQSTSPQLVMQFDLFVVMEEAHRAELRSLFPGIANKIFTLRELAGGGGDFEDPVGGDLERYRETADELSALLEKAFPRIRQLTGVD